MAASIKAFLVTMAIMAIADIAHGKNYTVGSPGGSWDLATDYTTWVSDIVFYTGDVLIFSYTSAHDVAEVTKVDYDSCTGSGALSTDKSGKTIFPLTKAGTRYFICAVPSHCTSGMQVEIKVVAKPSSPAPAMAPTPPSAPSAPGLAPPPSGTVTPAPAPKSNEAGVRNIVGSIVTAMVGFGLVMVLA